MCVSNLVKNFQYQNYYYLYYVPSSHVKVVYYFSLTNFIYYGQYYALACASIHKVFSYMSILETPP